MNCRRTGSGLLLVCLLIAAGARGEPAEKKPGPVAPLGPVATPLRAVLNERLAWAVDVMADRPERFKELPLSAAVKVEAPPEKLEESMREMREKSGGMRVIQSRILDVSTIGAWMEEKKDRRARWILTIGVERASPHLISKISLERAPSPEPPGEEFDEAKAWEGFDARARDAAPAVEFVAEEIVQGGERRAVHALGGDDRMALGLGGVIFVQLALARAVDEGVVLWDQKLAINDTLRAPPDSRTVLAAEGREVAVSDLSRRMLLEGDNTAAEHLIAMLGRERLDAVVASVRGVDVSEVEPFLSIIEFYKLKVSVTPIMSEYGAATNAERRRMLEEALLIEQIDPTLFKVWKKPQELERVGWRASAREVCAVMAELWERSKKPGNEWAAKAFEEPMAGEAGALGFTRLLSKQGTEPGVVSQMAVLVHESGRVFVAALLCNNANVDTGDRRATASFVEAVSVLGKVGKVPNGKGPNGK